MKLKSALYFGMILLSFGCRKDGKGCWQAFDKGGADAPGLIICGKTKAEAEAMRPEYWFYRAEEQKYCWQVQTPNGTTYTWDVPQSMAEKMHEFWGFTFTRTDCRNFCFLEWHEKHKSKITGFYGPTYTKTEYLLSGDSCSKLSVGKIVVIRETTDSIITRELVEKKP